LLQPRARDAMKPVVVIPAFRAAATLPRVVATLPEELWERGGALIVDDASDDDTGAVAQKLAAQRPGLETLRHPRNRGYGGALKTGLARALELGADFCPVVHADAQYAPEKALDLGAPIEAGITEIVQGSRFAGGGDVLGGGMPRYRSAAIRALSAMQNFCAGARLAEWHSGFMCYSARILRQTPFERLQENYNFDGEMMLLASLLDIPIVEVPIPTRFDEGSSSLSPIPYGMNVLRMMWRFNLGHYRALLDDHDAA